MVFLKALLFTLLISSAIAGEKVDIIGNVSYSKLLNSFTVTYLKDDKAISHFIQVKNQNEFKKLKSLIGKSIRIEGELNWTKSTNELFSFKEELSIKKISSFELGLLSLNTIKPSLQETLFSNEKKFKPYSFSMNFNVSDKTANTIIATSAVVLSVAGGPAILAPVAIFGLTQLATK